MTVFHFKSRTGKDLFDFLELSEIDRDRAYEQALTSFVLYEKDNKLNELTVKDITKLSNKALVKLKSNIFPLTNIENINNIDNNKAIEFTDDDGGIYKFNRKEIPSNLIEKISTMKEKKGITTASLLYSVIPDFFDITHSQIMESDFRVIAFMFQEIDSFFQDLTQSRNDIDIEDAWTTE